jgi:hypothetical protein
MAGWWIGCSEDKRQSRDDSQPSYPAKAGYPVRRGFSANHDRLWNTGSSAFADDDSSARGKLLILDPVAMQIVAVGVEPALGALDMVADAVDHAPEPG